MEHLKGMVIEICKVDISTPYLSNGVKWLITFVGGFIGTLTGGVDGLLYALLVFIVIDYISGLSVARVKKEITSEIGWAGITKKTQTLLMVVVGNILDTKVIGAGSVFRTAIIMLYIVNECISIMENTANLGLPVPKKVVEWLVQVKKVEMYKADDKKEVVLNENNSKENTEPK